MKNICRILLGTVLRVEMMKYNVIPACEVLQQHFTAMSSSALDCQHDNILALSCLSVEISISALRTDYVKLKTQLVDRRR